MQIGHMRFSSVERDDHPLSFRINPHILHAVDSRQRLAQFAHAFIAIFAFRRDLDGFDNWLVAMSRKKRAGRIGIIRASWIHYFKNAAGHRGGCDNRLFDRFRDLAQTALQLSLPDSANVRRFLSDFPGERSQHRPNILCQNFVSGRVRMNAISEIESGIAAHAL
jgi:hypothetical protein